MATYLVVAFAGSSGSDVPAAFSEARVQGAVIAKNIVDASNQSASDIELINKLDKGGNYTEALNVVARTVGKSQEIRSEAINLSAQLENMTKAVSGISSDQAKQAALESISSYLSLISRLINYSGYLEKLLGVLRNRFVGNFSDQEGVADLIKSVNGEIQSINDFNTQADQAIKRFDQLVK